MLEGLIKKPGSVLGIDCSTKTLAYAKFSGGKFERAGEIFFKGNTLWERLSWIHEAVPALVEAGVLDADVILFERAYVGNNVEVGLNLAYVYGAVIGALMSSEKRVAKVMPLVWQSYIGNPNLTKAEKDAVKAETPGKSKTWYSNANRELRKQRTLTWARQYAKIHTDSDNVSDAIGIGYYGMKNWTKLEYNK